MATSARQQQIKDFVTIKREGILVRKEAAKKLLLQLNAVIPANAGIQVVQLIDFQSSQPHELDSRIRGNDGRFGGRFGKFHSRIGDESGATVIDSAMAGHNLAAAVRLFMGLQ
jgi:hypothetical protein